MLGGPAPETPGVSHRDEILEDIEERHFWFRSRARGILATLQELLGPLRGRTALDIGCGTGFVLAQLERAGMVGCGLDIDLHGLRRARRHTTSVLVHTSGQEVPFTGQFDVAMLCDVIEHVDDDAALLRAAARATTDDGYVLVTVPAHEWLWSPVDEVSGHRRRYSRSSLAEAIRRAGSRVVVLRYFQGPALPLLMVSRGLQRLRGDPADPERLMRESVGVPPAPLNALLDAASSIDIRLSRTPLAFGASLIAIAERATGRT